jgi:predicted O-methyltransferase YrrM
MQLPSLTTLGTRYETDKAPVLTEYYATHLAPLRTQPIRLLEIGVFFGASLKMWHSYFPTGTIYGIDTFEGNQGNGSHFSGADSFLAEAPAYPRIVVAKCDQSKRDDLERFAATIDEPFDIILDDGSHLMKDQQQTLGVFWPLLRPGGLYFMEDYASSYDTRYPDVKPDFSNTTATLMKTFQTTGRIVSEYMTSDEADRISRELVSIDMQHPNSAVLFKSSH